MAREVGEERAEDAGVGGPGLCFCFFRFRKREVLSFGRRRRNSAKRIKLSLALSRSLSIPLSTRLTEVNITQTTPPSPALSSIRENASMSRMATILGRIGLKRGCRRAGCRDAGPTSAGGHGGVAAAMLL